MSSSFKLVQSITMKRKHIHSKGDDKYGHWWFEIGDIRDADSESYGWWPEHPTAWAGTLIGTRVANASARRFGITAR